MEKFEKRGLATTLAVIVGLGGALVACSGKENVTPTLDAGGDASAETSTEAGGDSASDAAGDTASEASSDAGDAADATDATETSVDAGSPADCLPTTDFATIFTLQDANKCVVGQYSVAATGLTALTWGRHGGPLGFDGTTTPTIVRYQVPGTATGSATAQKQTVTVPGLPTTSYWGSQAVDLPFFGWTAIAYTGNGVGFPGELVLVDGTGGLTRYDVNGLFAMSAVGLSGGRILYTGLSTIGTAPTTMNQGALYAADACGTASVSPRLVPNGDTTCTAPSSVASWQAGTSGPVTKDPSENLFAILDTYMGNQEIRGFERSKVAHGAPPTPGDTVATMTGGGTELAGDGKSLFFQPTDASYTALDVIAIDYTVDTTQKKITAAAPRTLLKLVNAGTSVSLVVDDAKRLWVAVAKSGSTTESWLFVLRDKNP
jgi:hypothetical protein